MNTEHTLRYLASKGVLTVWYIRGDEANHLWVTKADAERYCADRFGDEPADKRYSRIYYKNVETYFG